MLPHNLTLTIMPLLPITLLHHILMAPPIGAPPLDLHPLLRPQEISMLPMQLLPILHPSLNMTRITPSLVFNSNQPRNPLMTIPECTLLNHHIKTHPHIIHPPPPQTTTAPRL